MKPLKIAFLWHFHQPYYRFDDEFILPWVRLHGVKDYWDLPELFHEFPGVKHTINLAPSLSLQIDEYLSGKIKDKIQLLTEIPADKLDKNQTKELIRLFFLANRDNMINPHPRYNELSERAAEPNAEEHLTISGKRDLQTWYNLCWIGNFSKQKNTIKRLLAKGRDFTEFEKRLVLEEHLEILSKIDSQFRALRNFEQVEFSVSPMYHPILPLLCDTDSAREAMPDLKLPDVKFSRPEDARAQIDKAFELYESKLNGKPAGMWPSEGSISNEVLKIMIEKGIKWAASDEKVLEQSVGDKYDPLHKFFPRKYKSDKGDIALLFRDHTLSDAIGFVYSRWNHFDAVNDFTHRLRHIKSEIANKFGEESLDRAVVPVILDGENCWEFYKDNGVDFLRELFRQISDQKDFETVRISDAIDSLSLDYLEPIDNVKAGSWINANFAIWIDGDDERAAWEILAETRELAESKKNEIGEEKYREAIEEIYITEGSDWFWWYGDDHSAENKSDFDVLFRKHIARVYETIGEEPPEIVKEPLSEQKSRAAVTFQTGDCSPRIDGAADDAQWENAAIYDAKSEMSAMHQIGEIMTSARFAVDEEKFYLRIDLKRELKESESIEVDLTGNKTKIIFFKRGFELKSGTDFPAKFVKQVHKKSIEFAVSKNAALIDGKYLEIAFETRAEDGTINYPRKGNLTLEF